MIGYPYRRINLCAKFEVPIFTHYDNIALHAKWNHHAGNKRCERYLKHIAHCYTDRHLSVWEHTYTVRPKLHLVNFWSKAMELLSLSVLVSSAVGARNRFVVDGIIDLSYRRTMANLTPQLRNAHAKIKSREPIPRPFWGWFVIPLARLDIIALCTKLDSSSFSHSWDMDGAPKI